MLDVDAYLQRIGYAGPREPSPETLRALHVAHLLSVPFENLDIHLGRPIVLDEAALFDKIVRRRRGGFCYELNGLFSALLRALGFRVARLSAGVLEPDGSYGPDFDHMTLLVHLDERWLADVGFGDGFLEPLRFDEPAEQVQGGRAFRVAHDGQAGVLLYAGLPPAGPQGYRFSLEPRELRDYEAMCRYHQTSPDSSFVQRRVCTRATPTGRVTLRDARVIVTANGRRDERSIEESDRARILREQFGIDPADLATR